MKYPGPVELAGVNQEVRVGQLLLDCGFTDDEIKHHPNGTQNHPDYLVLDVKIECKTTNKKPFPKWNNTAPDKETLYVFSCNRTDNTVVFFGEDVFSGDVKKHYDNYIEELTRIQWNYNNLLRIMENPYGFHFRYRSCIDHRGGIAKSVFANRELLFCQALERVLPTDNA